MGRLYWPLLGAAFLFVGYCDTHTDEVPIILGIVLILSGCLGLLFPGRWLATIAVLGPAVFLSETLVHYHLLSAPWQAEAEARGGGPPWGTLLAMVPAFAGAGIGALLRRLAAKPASV